jgi:hypothetical protein
MPWMAAAVAVSAAASAYAANKAGKAQKSAANKASSTEMRMQQDAQNFNEQQYRLGKADALTGFRGANDILDPYDKFGVGAGNKLAQYAGLTGGGQAAVNALAQDPGYQFRMTQGVNAMDRSAAARGMLNSGAQQKALVGYGQGLASEELNNAFNRVGAVQNNSQQAANALANISQNRGTTLGNMAIGQGSQNQALMQNSSNALGQYAMAAGQARAGAYENVGSSINSGIQNGLMAYGMYQQSKSPLSGAGRNRGY